jgi:acetoacetyl-CoA reductase/3-oxoacyl-[acyl-carrier protein] reductase
MILITGASKGIGNYLLKEFSKSGYHVVGTYNDSKPDDDYLSLLSKVDVTDIDSVSRWINYIKPELNNIVLINCASISYTMYAHKSDLVKWKKVIDVNLIGTFNVIWSILPLMREQSYGRIINFSSVVAQIPTPGVSAYAASKSALWGLSKSLAAENGSKGITINSINLGYANIGMGINEVPKEYQQQLKLRIPSASFCEPEIILKTVKYIIDSDYLNGASVDLNGGLN